MEIILSDASKIVFDNLADSILDARFQHFNTYVFDSSCPDTTLRWGMLYDPQGFCTSYGCNIEKHDALAGGHIFIDQRLRDRGMSQFVDLVLLHEMCHFSAATHNPEFVKRLLRALQRVNWEPLVGKFVPCEIPGLDD